MEKLLEMQPTFTFLEGDVIEQLKTISDGIVDCIVTSPPYNLLVRYLYPTYTLLITYLVICLTICLATKWANLLS